VTWRTAPSARSHPVLHRPGVANHQDPVTLSRWPHSDPGSVDRMVKENDMTLANEQIITNPASDAIASLAAPPS
jgi:pterin-4a-carbinolamine dehydratase